MRNAVEALAADGFARCHAVIRSESRPRCSSRHLVSITRIPSDATVEQSIATILSLAAREGTEALLPVWTDDVAMVSACRTDLKPAKPVLTPDPELLNRASDKLHFARLLEELGMMTPPTLELRVGLDPDLVAEQLGFPMLIKPRRRQSGEGIHLLASKDMLRNALVQPLDRHGMILQQVVPGEDVALTLLADHGDVFAVIMKKRWYTSPKARPFAPYSDFEYFSDPWLEEMGRQFLKSTCFSGIADFDLRVDFAGRRAWFLECDPRLMGSISANRLFGVNVPRLLVEHELLRHQDGDCFRTRDGYFLSLHSLGHWIAEGGWRTVRKGPLRTNWKSVLLDPFSRL